MRIHSNSPRPCRGLTLLELTIIIMVLLGLMTLFFTWAQAWKRGGDRSACILNVRNVQMAMRSYQNINGYTGGDPLKPGSEAPDIGGCLHQRGFVSSRLYEAIEGAQNCPAGGTYVVPVKDVFPPAGNLFMVCSLAESSGHVPGSYAGW